MRVFVDRYRHTYGAEPICRVMQITPSGYWGYEAQQCNPASRCARAERNDALSLDIKCV